MASVSVEGVRKRYGALEVIHGIDIAIPDGEFVVLVGPSGCGKSTLLRKTSIARMSISSSSNNPPCRSSSFITTSSPR